MAKIDKKYDIKFINHWDNGFHFSKMIWRERCRWRNTWWWLDLEPHFQHWYGITTLTSIYCLNAFSGMNARPPLLINQRWDGNIFPGHHCQWWFSGVFSPLDYHHWMFFLQLNHWQRCFLYHRKVSPLNGMVGGNHWKQWFFSDGSWVRQPLVTMDSKPKGIIVEV